MVRRPSSRTLALFALLATTGCKQDEGPPSTDPIEIIPAEIQGIYGRTSEDAPGMVVSASGLEFKQMKLTIHAATMEGDTVRVERATLQWEKSEPKTCNGTIARQGDRLLLALFQGEAGEHCESTLDAAWSRWELRESLPELVRGRYGNLLIEPDGMRLDIDWISTSMKAATIYELPGSNDERADLLIRDAKVVDQTGILGDFECSGTMKLEDGKLTTEFWVPERLVPEIGSEQDKDEAVQAKLAENREACERWSGSATKWTVDLAKLPKAKISKGTPGKDEVALTIAEGQAILAAPDLRCEMPLWRTESVPSDAHWDPAAGGERMTLAKAEPKQIGDACKLKLRIWCERQIGNDVGSIDAKAEPGEEVGDCIEDQTRDLCPDEIHVRSVSDVRFKLGAGPDSFNEIACVDTTGDFLLAK
ncbi:hypothetical protein ACNOYE_30845 [Nannocystaceae bacterium ST9]